MKQLLLLLLVIGGILHSTTGYAQDTKDWTMIVFLVGSNLESGDNAGTNDIAEMMSVPNTSNANILVLTGGANKEGWRTPKAYEIKDGEQIELDFVAPNTSMSSPENLTAFIDYSITNYPSRRQFVDMWNHGMAIRGYGHDEVSDTQFSISQVKSAIAATSFITNGGLFDLIGFDACLMATLEAQYTLKEYGEYFVASEEEEPGHGWDYQPIVEAMQANGTDFTGADLGYVVVDGFQAQAQDQSSTAITLSVSDLFEIDNLVAKLEILFNKIEEDGKSRILQQARGKSQEYAKNISSPVYSEDMVDIADLAKKIKALDPALMPEADSVLVAIGRTVLYEIHDSARPQSTGMTMYLPHNVLVDPDIANSFIAATYTPLPYATTLENFVTNVYVPAATSDNTPPSGTSTEIDGFNGGGTSSSGRSSATGGVFSAILVNHASDLEQVQVVLVEEFAGMPNEFIILGSTFPDTSIFVSEEEEIFGYEFDGLWLGINGFPAYISDLHEYELENEEGEVEIFTQIHIPALLNPTDTSIGREIMISYRYDEEFNITLESIMPESFDVNGIRIPGKERIQLEAGDVVQLTYESFNEVTDEEFFVIDDDAIIIIENGNEDLMLEYDDLAVGDYRIGYLLQDHSQNDTLIFDDNIFSVITDAVVNNFVDNNISMYPNPANVDLTIENENFTSGSYSIRLLDVNGRQVYQGQFDRQQATVPTSALPSGVYAVELIYGQKIYTDKVVISH